MALFDEASGLFEGPPCYKVINPQLFNDSRDDLRSKAMARDGKSIKNHPETYIWITFNDLTTISLESWLVRACKGHHPQIALFQVSEIL